MFTSTLNDVKGERYEALGVVTSNVTPADSSYYGPDPIKKAMDKSIEQLSNQAKSMGADGVIGVTFIFSKLENGTLQVSAFGTAIEFTGTDSEETV